MERTTSTSVGVSFPLQPDGKVSTTATGKEIWAAAVGELDADLADAIRAEKDWRHNYAGYAKRVADLGVSSPEAAMSIAANGCKAANDAFQFFRDGKRTSLEAAAPREPFGFHTGIVRGEGTHMSMLPRVPHNPPGSEPHVRTVLDLGSAANLVQAWADYGSCEASCAQSIRAFGAMDMKQSRAAISENVFVLLGATSELGPFKSLMEVGATVVAISRNGAKLATLISSMDKCAGSVVVPLSVEQSTLPEDDVTGLSSVAGADLIAQTPEVIAWLSQLFPEKTLVLDMLVYLDGEANVRASVAMDMICAQVAANRGPGKTALAYLVSPATAHPVSPEARDVSVEAYKNRSWLMSAVGAGPSYGLEDQTKGDYRPKIPVLNGCIVKQGPNYCLAKTMQQWRALVARADGQVVSANLAPPCRTVSVCRNPQIAAALEGLTWFPPLACYDPDTVSAIMTILLLWDLAAPESSAQPATPLDNPSQLFVQNAFHGGNWRCAYNAEEGMLAMTGFVIGKVTTSLFGYRFQPPAGKKAGKKK